MGHRSVAEHRAAVERLLGDGSREPVPLDRRAAGRRLAADLVAADHLPRFDSSAMDGYAVCPGSADQRTYPVVGDVPAGSAPTFALVPGQAARVMTGARVPEGTVAVVPVELTDASPTGPAPESVTLEQDPLPGRHVRRRGEDVTAGAVIATAGAAVTPALLALARSAGCTSASVHVPTRVAVIATGAELAPPEADPGAGGIHESNSHMVAALAEAAGAAVTPALLALARSAGCTSAPVHVPTRVAVIATGAELAPPEADPGAGGIHESNSHMVAALAEAAGCRVLRVEVCSDEPDELRALLDELDADPDVDLVVTTGGVSAGAYEVVRQVCSPLPTFDFVHLAMQPGGPQGLGCYGSTPVVCLPGTPVGAFVAFHVLVRPGLDRRHGVPTAPGGRAAYVGKTRHTRAGRVQFVTSVLHDDGTVTAPDARHLTALAAANCLIEVPEGVDQLVEGDVVVVHPV